MTTRRTIHAMTDGELQDVADKEWEKPEYASTMSGIRNASLAIARRLAGPDPAMLVEALRKMITEADTAGHGVKDYTETCLMCEAARASRAALAEWDAKMKEIG